MAHAPSLTESHELDCTDSSNERTTYFPESTPGLTYPSQTLRPVGGTTTGLTEHFGEPCVENSKESSSLGILTCHLVGSLIQLGFLDQGSALALHLDSYEKYSDGPVESGTIVLLKNNFESVQNVYKATEIRISWKECKPDNTSEVDSGLEAVDVLSYYSDLDQCVDLTESVQPSILNYQVTIESYSDHEDSHGVHHYPACSELATEIFGQLYHWSNGMVTHWYISSQSGSRLRHFTEEPIDCVNISVSYIYDLIAREADLSVVVRINSCIEAFIQLGLRFPSGSALENGAACKVERDAAYPQGPMTYGQLVLNADCRYVNKYGNPSKQESTSIQKREPTENKPALNLDERSAAQKIPRISQSRSNSKAGKRRRDSEESGSETTPRGTLAKKVCVLDDTGGLACPFYKMDPWGFDRCLAYKMSKMSYVKQHLFRYHDTPHCNHPTCEADQGSHTEPQQCRCRIYVMTAEQKGDIQRAAGRKITPEGKWYQIWSILFPGAKKPDSPFVKAHYFAEVLSSIQTFYQGSKPPHILEKTCYQVLKNRHSYELVFDGLLQRIEKQLLNRILDPGSSCQTDDNSTKDEYACRKISRGSLGTDIQEPLSTPSIPNSRVPGASANLSHEAEAVSVDYWSETLRCSPAPQGITFTWNGGDASESLALDLGTPNPPQFHPIDWSTESGDACPSITDAQETINYADDTIICQMGAVFDFIS